MKNDGGAAFPKSPDETYNGSTGMSLRDYFAAQAMVGILAGPLAIQVTKITTDKKDESGTLAEAAFDFADAMLEARKR